MRIYPGRIMNNFIEQNKRQYAIPVYQRNYEWAEDQCVKLFNDIVTAAQRQKEHFCGSVVYSLVKNENNINYYIIIDGQQRMTTVYLLLKALMDLAKDDNEKNTIKNVLMNNDPFQPYSIDAASKLKLKPIKSDNNQLLLLMDGKFDEVDKASGIWYNYNLFCDLIKKKQDEGITVSQIYYGMQQLTCVDIALEADDNAQEIFERINSTGVPLSLADKIRNFVLMVDIDQERLYEDYWLVIEKSLHKENMEAFFLDYLNMKLDGFAKADNAYDLFKIYYWENKYTNESMLKELLHYAEFYKTFLYGNDKYSKEINSVLADLQKLKQTTVFLFLFKVFDDYENGSLDTAELERVLNLLLNYSIRRLICDINSGSLRGFYKTLHSRIFTKVENKNRYYDAIVSFLVQLTSKDALPTDEMFVYALKNNNLYRKNALCKYLLSRIENQGKEKLKTDNLTIEHIMPQNKNLSTVWQKMLGENWEADRDKYLHTLGNLTLTAYNSELGDKPFDEKKELLSEFHTKVVLLNEDVKDCDVWNASTIETRAENLASEITKLFVVNLPEPLIVFTDPRYNEYTCDEPENATYKTLNYYILQGERVAITNFADMLRSIIERLYVIDPTIIEEMARNNARLLSWSQNIMFSYDVNKVSGDYKLAKTNIYESTGFSAAHIMYIVQALLDRYDIDRSDFVYSARSYKSTDKEV